MKTSELRKGLKVITVSRHPVAGHILKWTCQSGKNENDPANIFIKIRKLDGIITYATADMVNKFKPGAE